MTPTRPITVLCASREEAVALAAADKDARAMTSGPGTLKFHSLIAEHGAGTFKTLYVPMELSHTFKTPAGGTVRYASQPIAERIGELPFPPTKSCQQGGEHDWHTTDNWLIDRCSVCKEERA